MRIGFLGLGHMGVPMARNLLGIGHTVTVYNRTPGRAKPLLDLGAEEATTVADAVKNAEVAITMLADDAAVTEVIQGPAGLLQNLPPRGIHLCMCTIGVETSATLALAHAKANQGYVAAPVFGRVDTVESRHIWIVAGGPEAQVKRCLPIFNALSLGHMRVGSKAALAHALKLGGNVLLLAMEKAVSEILAYAGQAGVDPADYLRLLNTTIFKSHLVDDVGGVLVRPSFDPADQTLDLAANELLFQASRRVGVAIQKADLINAQLQAAGARGWGEQDLAALSQASRREAGTAGPPIPVLQPPLPNPPGSNTATWTPQEPKKVANSKGSLPQGGDEPPPVAPLVANRTRPLPPSGKAPGSDGPAGSPPLLPTTTFPALEGKTPVTLDLNRTSHFEVIKGQVWAWTQGKRYETPWSDFSEVELAFNHVLFLLIQRHVLLRPEAVLNVRSTFGGGAKARVGENTELNVSRAAAARLKELLGI